MTKWDRFPLPFEDIDVEEDGTKSVGMMPHPPPDLAELVDELNGWMKDIHATLERIAKALEDLTDVTRFNGGGGV